MVKTESKVVSDENGLKDIFSKKTINYYEDRDLKTPEHDKIMDHLIDDAMISKIANIVDLGRGIIFNENDKWDKKEEFPIKIGYNFKHIDLCATIYKYTKLEGSNKIDRENFKMNIEVKTSILSIGELIRQINTYRKLNNGIYIVIVPNVSKSLRNRLNNSNIYVIDTKEFGIEL